MATEFIDKARISVSAGKGGNGAVAFHREKYIAAGGPDGGDGGNGGDIILQVDDNMSTLMDFRYKRKYTAENGMDGQGSRKFGKSGKPLTIRVPRGTLVRDAETNEIIQDMSSSEPYVLCRGGKGGWGNCHFATPTRQVPRFAKAGLPGESHDVILELKLLADVGLIGFPNVGKSTLLNTLAPALHRETGQISQKLGRGRHTTREVEIFEICGGRLADTPGFASLEAQKLCRIPKDDLQHTFPEFGPYFGQCRFTGCSHRSETGCAVREAVEAGTISKTRYASYLAMYEEASARKEWEK